MTIMKRVAHTAAALLALSLTMGANQGGCGQGLDNRQGDPGIERLRRSERARGGEAGVGERVLDGLHRREVADGGPRPVDLDDDAAVAGEPRPGGSMTLAACDGEGYAGDAYAQRRWVALPDRGHATRLAATRSRWRRCQSAAVAVAAEGAALSMARASRDAARPAMWPPCVRRLQSRRSGVGKALR